MFTATWVVFHRQMRQLMRNPAWVFFGLAQPILFLVFFGPLLQGLSGGGLGGEGSWNIFVPGLLIQLCLFGAGFAGFGIIQELREGVVDRQRVTPAPRLSLLMGRTLCNVVTIGLQGTLLTLAAIPFGLKPSWGGVLLSIALVSLLALGIAAASYSMGLILGSEESFSLMIQSVTLPLLLLSGVFLPMSLAPGWLLWLSRLNPLSYIVQAERALFHNELGSSVVLTGVGVTVGLSVVLAFWATRRFGRLSA